MTFSTYAAFAIASEFVPILKMFQLIMPIIILVMLKGKECVVMIGIDFSFLAFGLLRTWGLFETGGMILSKVPHSIISDIPTATAILCIGCFSFQAWDYILSWRFIKAKKIRERIGKV